MFVGPVIQTVDQKLTFSWDFYCRMARMWFVSLKFSSSQPHENTRFTKWLSSLYDKGMFSQYIIQFIYSTVYSGNHRQMWA